MLMAGGWVWFGWVGFSNKIRISKAFERKKIMIRNVESCHSFQRSLEKLSTLKRVRTPWMVAHSKKYSTKLPRAKCVLIRRVELHKRCPSISTKRRGGTINPKTYLRIHPSIYPFIHPSIHLSILISKENLRMKTNHYVKDEIGH